MRARKECSLHGLHFNHLELLPWFPQWWMWPGSVSHINLSSRELLLVIVLVIKEIKTLSLFYSLRFPIIYTCRCLKSKYYHWWHFHFLKHVFFPCVCHFKWLSWLGSTSPVFLLQCLICYQPHSVGFLSRLLQFPPENFNFLHNIIHISTWLSEPLQFNHNDFNVLGC